MNGKSAIALASLSLAGVLAFGTAGAIALPVEKQPAPACSCVRAKAAAVDQRSIAFTRIEIQALRALERMP